MANSNTTRRTMIPTRFSYFLVGLILLISQTSFSQDTLISHHHTLESCTNISAEEYPVQIARFTLDRPGYIKKIILHLEGEEKGRFKVNIYGHEGGTTFPALRNDLIPPIQKKKRRKGYQKITVKLKKPVWVDNDQFYIVLSDFTGDFGLKQDGTFYEEFCCSTSGGNYYPTLLVNNKRQIIGENCHLTMDVQMELEAAVSPIFQDATTTVGLPLHWNNEYIAWGDLDQDNWLDLIVGGHLYKNNQGLFTDITEQTFGEIPTGINGAAFVDMNNDGRQDILLFGTSRSLLYLNNGAKKFTKKELALPPLPSLHAFSIADIDGDQLLDVVVAQLWNPYPVPLPNYLFLNNGNNDFTNVTQRLYPNHEGQENFPNGEVCISEDENTYVTNGNKNRRSRGSQFVDVDLDGDVDLYITNYFLETDELFINDGNGFFTPQTPPKAVDQNEATDNHGTGVDWYDFDSDGDFDLLLPQLAHPNYMKQYDHRGTTIFRNDGDTFTDLKDQHGIAYEETHAGATLGDVNNDGLVDLLTTVYYGCRYVDLYLQRPNHRFQLSTYQSGLSKITTGNDACFVDYNNDGRLDLAMGIEGKFRLFENIKSNSNNWVKIQVKGLDSNAFGVGAIVQVYIEKDIFTQEVNIGRGQKMQKPTMLHFGLGTNPIIQKVVVQWPSGQSEEFCDLLINQSYTLQEGDGKLLH